MKILGLMSGTSFDGVDAAIVHFEKGELVGFGAKYFEPMKEEERALIRASLGQWQVSAAVLDAIHAVHNRAIKAIGGGYDLVGFHGQTLAHDPNNSRTFQAGDPSALEVDCPVVHDFRSQDVLAGGEGAPLVPIYHHMLAKKLKFKLPVVFVNIGGVANVTYVDPNLPPETGLIAFDCGIGNAIADDLVFEATGRAYDKDGDLAASGNVDEEMLKTFQAHPFFKRRTPKSLDRMDFAAFKSELAKLKLADAVATVNAFTIWGIAEANKHFPSQPEKLIICGGGRKNPMLLRPLGGVAIDQFGLDGDMTEAEAFAYLALLRLEGRPASFPMTTGVRSPMVCGQILRGL